MSWQDPEATREAERYASPIPSRTLILQTLEQQGQPMTHQELVLRFGLHEPEAIEALSRRLSAMVRDSQLLPGDGMPQTYRPLTERDVLTATIQVNASGTGWAVLDGMPDLALGEKEMRLVFHGDTVQVRASGTDRRGRLMGRIVQVLKRQQSELIGKVDMQDGQYFIQPGQPNLHQPIAMEPEQIRAAGLSVGDHARIGIDEWPTREEFANGHIIQPLSGQVDSQLIIPATLLDYAIPHEFSEAALAEAAKYKNPTARDRQGRVDLRELPLVTIDGEDSRDFDDAVYAEKRKGGGYRLIVAIADVSHYVRPGMALDDEAQERGTSVYFPNHVVPMLPEALSNGLCSLNPHVDRLCMVCDLTVSRTGKVMAYAFYNAVMHSQARLTYTQVNQHLQGDKTALPAHDGVRKSVDTLHQLYKVLLDLRGQRGAMEFETTETYMTFDDLGAIEAIKPRTRNDAHRLIEECMLLANVSAASYALANDLPVLYRNHEPPQSTKVQKVRDFVRLMGLDFPENPTQSDYQHIIEATRDRIDAPSIHAVLLRSMMQAFYGGDNLGHFGLAYESYTHFTSPIRRYPDLLLHRAIKAHLAGKKQPLDQSQLEAAGLHLSQTERRADEASRQVMGWLKCHYMQQHIGDQFEGVITAVTDFGLFITLTELYVEGLAHVRHLGDDFFVFDQPSQTLTGQHKGQRFALGDKVLIQVAGVNLDEGKIDFELKKQLTSAGRAVRERAPQAEASAPRRAQPKTASRANPSAAPLPNSSQTPKDGETGSATGRPSRNQRRKAAQAARAALHQQAEAAFSALTQPNPSPAPENAPAPTTTRRPSRKAPQSDRPIQAATAPVAHASRPRSKPLAPVDSTAALLDAAHPAVDTGQAPEKPAKSGKKTTGSAGATDTRGHTATPGKRAIPDSLDPQGASPTAAKSGKKPASPDQALSEAVDPKAGKDHRKRSKEKAKNADKPQDADQVAVKGKEDSKSKATGKADSKASKKSSDKPKKADGKPSKAGGDDPKSSKKRKSNAKQRES